MAATGAAVVGDEHPEARRIEPTILTDADFTHIDRERVRRYLRFAAAITSSLIVALTLLAVWSLNAFFDLSPMSIWIAGPAIVLILGAIWLYWRTEAQFRVYHLVLSNDGVVFENNGQRTHLLFAHVQLMDVETSLLLGRFHLVRLNLYTPGGKLSLSPVPVDVARSIEQLLAAPHRHVDAAN